MDSSADKSYALAAVRGGCACGSGALSSLAGETWFGCASCSGLCIAGCGEGVKLAPVPTAGVGIFSRADKSYAGVDGFGVLGGCEGGITFGARGIAGVGIDSSAARSYTGPG